jgi:hypothetical protein
MGGSGRLVDRMTDLEVQVELVKKRLLLQVRQDLDHPVRVQPTMLDRTGWKLSVLAVIAVQCQAELLEIVAARQSPRRFASGLNGRQQQGNQDTDDGDDYQ